MPSWSARSNGSLRRLKSLGSAQRHERLLPDVEAVGALLHEDHLPVVVAQAGDAAVVGPVDELAARPLRLARGTPAPGRIRRGAPCRSCRRSSRPFSRSSLAVLSPAAASSVGSMSSCAPMSLTTVPGLMTPGQRITSGTR